MSDRPEERRRTGPLGDEDDETRRVPTENGPEAKRQVREEAASAETRGVAQGPSEENETRVIRVPGHPDTTRDATPYPRGYFEATEEREDRLRDMYGGVDWLARFDGGRNGAMVLVWMFIVVLIIALAAALFSGFLPAGMPDGIANLGDRIVSTAGNLAGAGVVGLVTAVAALFIALLGGFLGGRMGSRYHTEIDRAT